MKKILYILLPVIVLVLGLAYYIFYTAQLPDLFVINEKSNIPVVKCPTGWDSYLKSFRADYPVATEIAKNIQSTKIRPQTPIELSFNRKPSRVEVTMIKDETEKKLENSKEIISPKESGTYVYVVWAYWKQGEIFYVFKVDI